MQIVFLILFFLVSTAIILLFDLSPSRITEDVLSSIKEKNNLSHKVQVSQGTAKVNFAYKKLQQINEALIYSHNEAKFDSIIFLSFLGAILGVAIAIAIDNLFLAPVLAFMCFLIPFLYAEYLVGLYLQHQDMELETTMSMITTSYIRSHSITMAFSENLQYLKPPMNGVCAEFVGETRLSADISGALYHLRQKVDNAVWREWCDALIQCQTDRTMADTLYPIVSKMTDLRLVNNEMETVMAETRMEYYVMVGLNFIMYPLFAFAKYDWYLILVGSIPGKIATALMGVVVTVTFLFMRKFTKKIEYEG